MLPPVLLSSFFTRVYQANEEPIDANAKGGYASVANTVTPPFTTWFNCTFMLVPTGKITSTRLPNFMKPSSSALLVLSALCSDS